MSVERVLTRDGLALAVEHRELEGARARLVIVHGYAEHRGRYAALIERLLANGIECHIFDLRGHGESEGLAAHVARFDDYLDDLDRVTASVRARGGTAPLLVLAHSLGGLIALSYVRAHPGAFEAIAVSSPFLGPAFPVPRVKKVLARVASVVAPAKSFETALDPNWISHDPDVVAAYANDPRVLHTTTARWFTEIKAAQQDLIAHAAEVTIPALFLLAADDRIADHRIAAGLFEHLGAPASQKRLRTYPGLYHEVFNERPEAREAVIMELLSWLDQRLASTAG
jgi:alpha-beta hydrolase superfamily lysophospholipase